MLCLLPFANAHALGLGAASLSSRLGDPLRLSFPVSRQPDEEVGCIQVRARGDDLPAVLNARAAVVRSGSETRIEVSSAQPVNEPAIGIVVSVGCTAPISREYVLFLDPPPVVPLVAPSTAAGVAVVPRVARSPRAPVSPAPSTQPRRAERSAGSGAASAPRSSNRTVRRTPSASVSSAATARAGAAASSTEPPPSDVRATGRAPSSAPTTVPGRDRLTIAPSEPPPDPTASRAVSAGNPATTVPPDASTAARLPSGPAGDGSAATAAAEQALRQQQADLQQQLKSLSDQIAALKVQTTTLANRNQALEEAAIAPSVPWILIALAAVALAIAAWMAWRYAQLRRSMQDATWWAGNTAHVPAATDAETDASADPIADATAALDPGTRFAPRSNVSKVASKTGSQTDARSGGGSIPQAPPAASGLDRSRPSARNARYPAAMDTDFTVSDIEAAMATVRTVSSPRAPQRPVPLEDSDFAPLGGPTMPSPFTQPPPAARSSKVVERDGDDIGRFVDLDIPPLATTHPLRPLDGSRSPSAAPRGATPVTADPPAGPEPTALDFSLDISDTGFDPLATDSLKTTIVDRPEGDDFEVQAMPTALDFELPSTTGFESTASDHAGGSTRERHGATALDDLFPGLGGPGADTILEMDDRHGAPLSSTEVDRLTTTATGVGSDDLAEASTRVRMARFADLVNQVDEVAQSEPLRAIALLRQYVLRDERIPTLLWLRLFDLYKEVGKKPVYEALSEHFARRYSRPMVAWTEQLSDRVPQTPLAAMTDLDRDIETLWGKDEGLERLRALLCDRDQKDAIVFNAALQRDLLDAAKVFPPNAGSLEGASSV